MLCFDSAIMLSRVLGRTIGQNMTVGVLWRYLNVVNVIVVIFFECLYFVNTDWRLLPQVQLNSFRTARTFKGKKCLGFARDPRKETKQATK